MPLLSMKPIYIVASLGTPNKKWWPDRRGLSSSASEFEAESVSYLVCNRLGIETPAEEYFFI